MRARMAGEMLRSPFRARDTVEAETPALRASVTMVVLGLPGASLIGRSMGIWCARRKRSQKMPLHEH
jgi:hypothetical protein